MFFFRGKSIGIDITDNAIEVAELIKSDGGIEISTLGRIELSPGVVVGGRIKKEKDLKSAVKKVLAEAKPHAIDAMYIVFGLPEAHTYTHIFPVADDLSEEDVDKLALKEAGKNIPIDEENMLCSYKIVEREKTEDDVILIATRNDVVTEWANFFQQMGITAEILDIEPFSIYRSLYPEPISSPICVVDIGHERMRIAVFGTSGLLKIKSVDVKEDVLADDPKTRILKPIKNKIISTLEEFREKTGSGVEEIVIVGASSVVGNVVEYMRSETEIPVKIGRQAFFKFDLPLVYIKAIGLAMRRLDKKWSDRDPAILPVLEKIKKIKSDKKNNNMDDLSKQDIRRKRRPVGSIIAAIVVVVLIIGGAYWVWGRGEDVSPLDNPPLVNTDLPGGSATTTPGGTSTTTQEMILISETPTDWLNVREGPSTTYPIVVKVYPGETYPFIEEQDEWYKIQIDDEVSGWVTSQYASKQ